MAIVFAPYQWSPETTGDGLGALRVSGFGLQPAGDYGVSPLPALRADGVGVYSTQILGDGFAAMPRLWTVGAQAAGGVGIARLPALSGDGLYAIDLTPQSGSGVARMPGMSSVNGSAIYGDASSQRLRLRGFGAEPAGDWGIGYLPAVRSKNTQFNVPQGLHFALYAQPTMTLYASTALAQLDESLTLAETTAYELVYAAIERLAINASPLALGSYLRQLDARLSMHDRLQSVYDALLAELVIVDDDILGSVVKTVALLDTLRLRDTPAGLRSALGTVVEAMTLASVVRSVLDEQLADVVLAQTALETRSAAIAHLLETLLASDVLAGLAVFTVDAADELVAADSVLTAMTLHAMIEDGLRVAVGLTLDGVPYTAMVLHTDTMGVTEYAPYDFNSLATFGGVTYGAGPGGLYRLTGDDDAGVPIDAFARTALARIANGRQAQVDSAYLGYSADGALQLKAIVTEPDGSKTARVYQLKAKDSDAIHAGRIKLGKGVKSAYWAFEISNVLGSDFTIDVIELHALALSRRV